MSGRDTTLVGTHGYGRPRRALLTAIAVLVAVIPLLTVSHSSEAAWTPTPVNLSAAGASTTDPVTAVGPNGQTAFAWRRLDAAGDWRIQLRVRSAAGALSAVQTVSPVGDNAYSPDVAIDGTGRAVVVWSQIQDSTGSHEVQAKIRSAAGQLSGLKRLDLHVGTERPLYSPVPQVEFEPSGAAVVAWQTTFVHDVFRVVTRTLTPAGDLGPWQTLSGDGVNLEPVSLAVDDDGTAFVAWARDDGTNIRIEARTRTAAGAVGPLKVITPVGQDGSSPDVAVTPDGRKVVAWVRFDTAVDALFARTLTAGGALGATKKISGTDKNVEDDPTTGWGEVAISDSGDVVVAWHQDKPCCSKEVAVRGLSASGALSAIAIAGTAYAYQPQVVIDPTGQAILSFSQRDPQFDDRIAVRTRSAAGALGPVQTLSVAGQDAHYSDLAVNDAGLAAVTWVRNDGSDGFLCCDRAQFALGP